MKTSRIWIFLGAVIALVMLLTRLNHHEMYTPQQRVTLEIYPRAEMNTQLQRLLQIIGKTNTFYHQRARERSMLHEIPYMVPMDTVESISILDTETNPTVTFYTDSSRYASMIVYDQGHYIVKLTHNTGTYRFNRTDSSTRYLLVIIRYIVGDIADMSRAQRLQNQCSIHPAGRSRLEIEEFDTISLNNLRQELRKRGNHNTEFPLGSHEYLGAKTSLDRALGTYIALGGLPKDEMTYHILKASGPYPQKMRLVPPPPVHDTGFWSFTVYDSRGTLAKKPNIYLNSKTIRYHPLGSVEITFTDDVLDTDRNTIHVDKESLVVVRIYRPQKFKWEIPSWARV